MKILIMCNVMLPEIAHNLNQPVPYTGGWLTGITEELRKKEDCKITVVFPQSFTMETVKGSTEHFAYYGFYESFVNAVSYHAEREKEFEAILNEVHPDIIHIFGTEWVYSFEMTQAAKQTGLLERVVVSAQGLVSCIAKAYTADLPEAIVKKQTFRDWVKKDSIFHQQAEYAARGVFEKKTISMVSHVIGRTAWDKKEMETIHPDVQYHQCQETMRQPFYEGNWNYASCEKHSIFLSQGYYPIKGFHKVLEALPIVLKDYPDTRLYVTGNDLLHLTTKQKLRLGSYQSYIIQLIHRYHLEEHVVFVGNLNAEQMKQHNLKANVFVCPSSIENSSNSIAEALLLGTPVVASDVGGTSSILTHEVEGYLYPFEQVTLLANYIKMVFEQEEKIEEMSARARERAKKQYDPIHNNETLLAIYQKMLEER